MSSTTLLYTSASRARRKRAFAAISEEIVTDFLAAAERAIEQRCDRIFNYSASRIEYYDGMNKEFFYLDQSWPIVSLDALVVIDANGDEDTIDVSGSDADVSLDTASGKVSFGPNNTSIYGFFPKTFPRNIKATITSGWALADVPDDLQEAVILSAMIEYSLTSLNMNAGLRRQKIGQGDKERVGQKEIDGWNAELERRLTRLMSWNF